MHGLLLAIHVFLVLFLVLLLIRLVFEVVKSLARDWNPSGFGVVLLEAVFTVTDPPIKLLRRLIPPIRLGAVRLDLSMLVLFILIGILQQVIPY
ncbi:YggT family protein [Tsukamurella sp. 8F]|uniref:YggT family protein n=1 Tax=unclassified Tsukamurella TaxID=2633480 RepID=UPI0023B89203|nr:MULTISPECIES: YggT family protein [unclassified Tsukamurella]MDF0532442.1 YggT family protein [Tsukamurella sp. 8J]MDF0588453.1 YggT family protein [Tsukamurella sp. 8F]